MANSPQPVEPPSALANQETLLRVLLVPLNPSKIRLTGNSKSVLAKSRQEIGRIILLD
jgi:hypothetical protein